MTRVSFPAAKLLGDRLGVDWRRVDIREFRRGLEVEQEHSDVTRGDPLVTARIVLAHLRERGNYYTLLDRHVERGGPDAASAPLRRHVERIVAALRARQEPPEDALRALVAAGYEPAEIKAAVLAVAKGGRLPQAKKRLAPVFCRKSSTGTDLCTYTPEGAGMERGEADAPGYPVRYYVICEQHGTLVAVPTLADARRTDGVDFCDACRGDKGVLPGMGGLGGLRRRMPPANSWTWEKNRRAFRDELAADDGAASVLWFFPKTTGSYVTAPHAHAPPGWKDHPTGTSGFVLLSNAPRGADLLEAVPVDALLTHLFPRDKARVHLDIRDIEAHIRVLPAGDPDAAALTRIVVQLRLWAMGL